MSRPPAVIGGFERKIIFGLFGAVDIAQLFLIETVIVGTILDVIAAIVLLVYGLIRRLWTTKKFLILLATFIGEAIPFVNALPFWVLDVKNLFGGTMTPEQAQESELAEMPINQARRPLYSDGARQPRQNASPEPAKLNKDGVRAPGGGLPKK